MEESQHLHTVLWYMENWTLGPLTNSCTSNVHKVDGVSQKSDFSSRKTNDHLLYLQVLHQEGDSADLVWAVCQHQLQWGVQGAYGV